MLISTKHKVELRLKGVSLVVQVFGHEPEYCKFLYFYLVDTEILQRRSENSDQKSPKLFGLILGVP